MRRRRPTLILVLCVAVAAATGAPARERASRAAKTDGALAVTLRVTADGAVSLVGSGALAGGPRPSRVAAAAENDFAATLETASGAPLETVTFADPTRLRSEWSPDGRRIEGSTVRLDASEVVVRFRAAAGAARVRVCAATRVASKARGGSARAMRTAGVFDLAAAKAAPPPPDYTTETLVDSGPSENRLDVVFLGDGYTASQLGQFRSDVLKVVAHFEESSPYDGFMPLVNFHLVNVVSNQSGIDDPAAHVSRDTALDLSFNVGGTQRCVYTTSPYKVYAAAALVPEYDQIFVIANDTQYGGCGGNFACFTIDPTADEIAVHEFGHSFGLLADEYGGDADAPDDEPGNANVTLARSLSGLQAAGKWDYWVPAGQRLPTPEGADGVGLFEGAQYADRGVFRPVDNCRMRVLGVPYCPICTEQLTRRLHAFADPIDAFAASPGPVGAGSRTVASASSPSGDAPDALDVRSVEIDQVGDALRLSLAVDGPIPDASASTGSYYVFLLSAGSTTTYVYVESASHRIYVSLPDGGFEDVGLADFGETGVSATVPLSRFGGSSALSWSVLTLDDGGDTVDTVDGGAFSVAPTDRVVLDTAGTFSGEGTPLSAPGATYTSRWFVDGAQAGEGTSFSTTAEALGAGLHDVTFEVSAATPLVRRDPEGLLDSTRELTVAVCGTGPTVRKAKLKVGGDGQIKLTGAGFADGTTVQVNGIALGGASQVKKGGKVLVVAGPLANGLPVSSVVSSGRAASVLVVAPSGECSTASVTP